MDRIPNAKTRLAMAEIQNDKCKHGTIADIVAIFDNAKKETALMPKKHIKLTKKQRKLLGQLSKELDTNPSKALTKALKTHKKRLGSKANDKPAKTVIYGKRTAIELSANGVKGVLCRSFDGQYFFRVYGNDEEFNDYLLYHDDLAVTITDECASFYTVGDDKYLDHDSQTFGLKTPDKI